MFQIVGTHGAVARNGVNWELVTSGRSARCVANVLDGKPDVVRRDPQSVHSQMKLGLVFAAPAPAQDPNQIGVDFKH